MVRKLEVDALKSDLAAVRGLLARRTPETDPIGHLQFSNRAEQIERQLAELGNLPDNKASIAVYFAGTPVQGSRGIGAGFAGKAVNLFQELVSKQFANMERGAMANVGPVPLRGSSDLLLTNVARGSFGVILEESNGNDSLTESELHVAVSKVAQDIEGTSQVDATAFEEMLGEVDARYFATLSQLFRLFDESNATVRMVESNHDISLDSQAVHRGRERTDAAIMNDDDDVRYSGRLFLLPAARKFELKVIGTGESIHGNVSREFSSSYLDRIGAEDVVNRDWIVRLKSRSITRPNSTSQVRYTLMGLVEQVSAGAT